MKKTKIIATLLALACLTTSVFTLGSCDNTSENSNNNNKKESLLTATPLLYQRIIGKNEYRVIGLGSTEVSNIVIPKTYNGFPVTSIRAYAFSYEKTIRSVTIPDTITEIESGVFVGCSNLISVTLPNTIERIDPQAFLECSKIVYYTHNGASYLGNDENPFVALMQADTATEIPQTTKVIFSKAFQNRKDITKIEIPTSVTFIGDYAFSNCEKLTQITLETNLKTIDACAFSNCASLTSITVADKNDYYKSINNVLYSKDGAILYQYATANTSLTLAIPEGVTTIKDYAFQNCKHLNTLVIPKSVTTIEKMNFANCSALIKIHFDGTREELRKTRFPFSYNSKWIVICLDGNIDSSGFNYI